MKKTMAFSLLIASIASGCGASSGEWSTSGQPDPTEPTNGGSTLLNAPLLPPAPGASFPCGSALQCDATTQYCSEFSAGAEFVARKNVSYTCRPLPLQCQPGPDCNCFPPASIAGCSCSQSDAGSGGTVVSCSEP